MSTKNKKKATTIATAKAETTTTTTKACTACKHTKNAVLWYRADGRGGRRHICKTCEDAYQRDRRERQRELRNAAAYDMRHSDSLRKSSSVEATSLQNQLDCLFKLTKKTPLGFEDLCDKMDLSPVKMRTLLKAAEAIMPIRLEHGHVGVSFPQPRTDVQETSIAPTVGERQRVAVISDTHFGSRYCLRGAIKDFIKYAYERGCREVLHVGDMLDGDYRHGKFEMTHMGLSDQAHDMLKNLPVMPGLTYHAITGNHDFTFTEQSGVNVGKHIKDAFAAEGRSDFKSYGDRGAFIKIRGALIHMWHPKQSPGYAVSYQLQRKVESYSPGDKPQILLAGHWHRFGLVEERGVHCVACPTFQSGGSAFSRSLTTGSPAIGGILLEWDLTADGTMRNFSLEKRTYFQRETVVRVETADGVEVE